MIDDKIMKNNIYTVLYERVDCSIYAKIRLKNPQIVIEKASNNVIWGVLGCYFDVKVGHQYDIIFNIDNLNEFGETTSIIKNVFALGYKGIEEIPATWGVVSIIEFPNGIPDFLCKTDNKYCLCSKKMWKDIMNSYQKILIQ
jgi:hypothetical protein